VERALLSEDKTVQEREKKKRKKASFFDRIANWRHREKDEADGTVYDLDLAKQVWQAFEAGGVDGNFDPPRLSDVPIIMGSFDFDLDALDAAKTTVKQLIQQESSGAAREGVTRDFLNQQFKALAPNCGEMLALWTYFQHRDQFNYKVLRSFQASHGQNPQQRKSYLPLFMRWVPDFTHLKPKI